MPQESDAPLLKVDALSRRYGKSAAVHDLSFSLRQGEVLGFLGRNGAGKSTAMQMISGTLAPSSGSVEIAGYKLLTNGLEAKRHIGFLPETLPLYPELTVDEYLRFAARLRGMATDSIPAALDECKARCGLSEHSNRLLEQLSDGLKKRAGIAQAIIHKPALIILDEPASALDPAQSRNVYSFIRALGKDCGVILSTHILAEVQELCDRVLIIHRGRTVLNQPLEQLQHGDGAATQAEFSFQAPPETKTLRELEGVAQVSRQSTHSFVIRYRPGMDATEAVLAASLAGGWRLRRCIPEEKHLEALFLRLTRDDPEAVDNNPLAQQS